MCIYVLSVRQETDKRKVELASRKKLKMEPRETHKPGDETQQSVVNQQLAALQQELKYSQGQCWAEGTRKNLINQWNTFLTFCTYFGLVALPAKINTVCLYAQCLARSFESVDSIRNYISTIRMIHVLLDMVPPNLKEIELIMALKGLYRIKKHAVTQAEAITPEILLEMREFMDLNDPFQATLWAMFLVAFFIMLRSSNLVAQTKKKFNIAQTLIRGDLTLDEEIAFIRIRWSKTVQFGQKVLMIPLHANPSSKLCPVWALNNMRKLNPAELTDALFCMPDKSVMIYDTYLRNIRKFVEKTGRPPKSYSTHSLRRGGCTWAFHANVNTELIKLQGNWASDCYFRYLQFPLQQRGQVSLLMNRKINEMFLKFR